MAILITDPVDRQCLEILRQEGFAVDYQPGLAPEKVKASIENAEALIVRSGTAVTSEVLASAKKLKVVGRAGAGVDNIDVDAATRHGVIVMNTPGGNTVAAAEHTMSLMLALARNVPAAYESLRQGKWERKEFVGTELSGKTLGIIGLGKVGTEVARRSIAFGMTVIAFDPVLSPEPALKLGVEMVSLDDIFPRSDFISLHTPLTPDTKHLLGNEALGRCKRGVRIVNCARGGVVDEMALLAALDSGAVSGAAFDVFEVEPPIDLSLIRHPRVVATPHLAASTEEAQEKVAIQIAHQVVDALKGRGISGSVNADVIQMMQHKEIRPYAELAERLGRLLSRLKEGTLKSVTVSVSGEYLSESTAALSSAVLKGLFENVLYEPVNYLNAPVIARERGIAVHLHQEEDHELYKNVLTIRYETDRETRMFSGTVFGNREGRIINMDGFHFEIKPEGYLLFYANIDRPGMLAAVGGILAQSGNNIAGLSLGRYGQGKQALTVVSLDGPVQESVLRKIADLEGVSGVKLVCL